MALLINSQPLLHDHHDSYYSMDYTMAFTATVNLVAGDTVETRFDYGIIKNVNFGGSLIDVAVEF